MFGQRLRRLSPGEMPRAEEWNALCEMAERAFNLTVDPSSGIEVVRTGGGPIALRPSSVAQTTVASSVATLAVQGAPLVAGGLQQALILSWPGSSWPQTPGTGANCYAVALNGQQLTYITNSPSDNEYTGVFLFTNSADGYPVFGVGPPPFDGMALQTSFAYRATNTQQTIDLTSTTPIYDTNGYSTAFGSDLVTITNPGIYLFTLLGNVTDPPPGVSFGILDFAEFILSALFADTGTDSGNVPVLWRSPGISGAATGTIVGGSISVQIPAAITFSLKVQATYGGLFTTTSTTTTPSPVFLTANVVFTLQRIA